MPRRIVVPFGPQHPVLPEPIHLDLVLKDEHVEEALPSIGYIHRGLETLVTRREYPEYVYIAERTCGICSFIHGMTYCQAVEKLVDCSVPERALFLRTIWSEYSRLHSHLLWLGLFADALGFENLFMASWRLRESVLDVLEETTGGRVIQGSCKVGGVRRDIPGETLERMRSGLDTIEREAGEIADVFLRDDSIISRTRGIGVLSREDAYALGAVGPTARASVVGIDLRKTGYAAYGRLSFSPVVETAGDCHARCVVRVKEIFTSIDLIRQAIAKIPDGPVEEKPKKNPEGDYFARSEQPRGELVHYVKGDGSRHLVRSRIRTPTLTNLPSLVRMLKGCNLADVPVIVLSIDPCIGCAER